LEYETVAMHEGVTVAAVSNRHAQESEGAGRLQTAATFRVTKMKFSKTKDASGKNVNDKTTVIYNEYITLKDIPLAQCIQFLPRTGCSRHRVKALLPCSDRGMSSHSPHQ
jgi:predicted helicase